MFKKIAALLVAFIVATCSFAVQAEAEIKFCESFDDQFMPVNVGTEFSGLQVSAFALFGKPVGKNRIVVSIYANDDVSQSVLTRDTVDINPRWDSFGFRYMTLPAYGSYTLSFEYEDGTPLASGTVMLKEPTPEAPAPEAKETESYGNTLEALFNKYSATSTSGK